MDKKNLNPYLLDVLIRDGEHEHYSHVVVWAKNIAQANRWGEKNTSRYGELDATDGYFSYGDGCTASNLKSVTALSNAEAKTLEDMGVAYGLNI